jgi:type IV pilus assembly protein PilB
MDGIETLLRDRITPFDPETQPLASALYDLGVSVDHIEIARKRASITGESLGLAMFGLGLVSSERVARATAAAYGMDYFGYERVDSFDPSSVQGITCPDPRAGVPIQRSGNVLTIAVASAEARASMPGEYAGFEQGYVVASVRTLQHMYRRYFSGAEAAYRDAATSAFEEAIANDGLRRRRGEGEDTTEQMRSSALSSNTPKFILALWRHAAYSGASDVQLHLVPTAGAQSVGLVKLKIDGTWSVLDVVHADTVDRTFEVCRAATGQGSSVDSEHIIYDGALKEQAFDEHQRELADIRREFDMRLTFGTASSGRTLTVRFLPRDSEALEFDRLSLDEADRDRIIATMHRSSGAVIVTGPTGSGKTTLRYAMLSLIDAVKRGIQTIENPVELTKGMWLQYQPRDPNDEGEASYNIFRGMLRNSPDVVDVAEVRSEGGFRLVMRAASTGHLVVVTQHADDAALALHMLRHAGISNDDIATNVSLVVGVRLVRLLCRHCKVADNRLVETQAPETPFTLGAHQWREFTKEAFDGNDEEHREYMTRGTWFRANEAGCRYCRGGYHGRRQVAEILSVDQKVSASIRSGEDIAKLRSVGIRSGQSLPARGLDLAFRGLTSVDELIRVMPRRRY